MSFVRSAQIAKAVLAADACAAIFFGGGLAILDQLTRRPLAETPINFLLLALVAAGTSFTFGMVPLLVLLPLFATMFERRVQSRTQGAARLAIITAGAAGGLAGECIGFFMLHFDGFAYGLAGALWGTLGATFWLRFVPEHSLREQ